MRCALSNLGRVSRLSTRIAKHASIEGFEPYRIDRHGLWPTDNFPDYSENPSIYGSPGEIGFYVIGFGLFMTYGKARFYGPPEGVPPT